MQKKARIILTSELSNAVMNKGCIKIRRNTWKRKFCTKDAVYQFLFAGEIIQLKLKASSEIWLYKTYTCCCVAIITIIWVTIRKKSKFNRQEMLSIKIWMKDICEGRKYNITNFNFN